MRHTKFLLDASTGAVEPSSQAFKPLTQAACGGGGAVRPTAADLATLSAQLRGGCRAAADGAASAGGSSMQVGQAEPAGGCPAEDAADRQRQALARALDALRGGQPPAPPPSRCQLFYDHEELVQLLRQHESAGSGIGPGPAAGARCAAAAGAPAQ